MHGQDFPFIPVHLVAVKCPTRTIPISTMLQHELNSLKICYQQQSLDKALPKSIQVHGFYHVTTVI